MSQQASVLLLINHLISILLHSNVSAGRGEDIDQMLAAGDATTADYLVEHDDDEDETRGKVKSFSTILIIRLKNRWASSS